MQRRALLLAGSLALARAAPSSAAGAPPPALDDPPPAEVDARYAAIHDALAEGEGRARLWWYGFTLGFAALTVGEGTLAVATHDPGMRAEAIVGVSGCALGVGAMLALTSRAAFAYRGRLDGLPASTPSMRLARLRAAERLLDEAADDEENGRSIVAHLAGDAVTLAGTFVLWAGYHRYAGGWLNLLGGTLTTEAQILTRPTAAIAARRAYRAGTLRPASGVTWSLTPAAGGAAVTMTF